MWSNGFPKSSGIWFAVVLRSLWSWLWETAVKPTCKYYCELQISRERHTCLENWGFWHKKFNPFLSTQMVSTEMNPCPFLPAHSIGWSQEWKKHSYLLDLNSTLQGKGQKNLREPELIVSRDTCLPLKTRCSTPGCIPGSQLGKGGWLYFPTHVLKLLSIPKLPCSF